MQDSERDEVLTEIQVNSAVTREKVEAIETQLESVEQTQSDQGNRLKDVERKASRNRFIFAVVGALTAAVATGVATEITKWAL